MSKAGFKRMMRERAVLSPHSSVPRREAKATVVPAYQPPTDEQLANFVAAMVNAQAEQLLGNTMRVHLTPRMTKLMLDADPAAKCGWLRRHREFQEALSREAGEQNSDRQIS